MGTTLPVNTVIANRYVIEHYLGRGGMADVYRAIQKELHRPVALKVMRSDTAWEAHAIARFKQEAVAVAKLEHHNIVSVYDYGEYEGNPFMVFRYIAGGSIKDRMGQLLEPALVLNWIRQISSALDYAHSKGIVHRDLKPDNVLMTEDGTLLLSDFGIAKLLEDDSGMTKTGSGFGTPHYMSPEQALGKKVDHRTDIYALGIMLYQMLTGKLPFLADTSYGVVMKHATESVPHIGNLYDAIIQRACAKSADDRYQSCGALVNDLVTAMKSAGVNIDQAVQIPKVVRTAGKDENSPTMEIGVLSPQHQPVAVAPALSVISQPAVASATSVQTPPQPAVVSAPPIQQQPAQSQPVQSHTTPPHIPNQANASSASSSTKSGVKTAVIASISVVAVSGILCIAAVATWFFTSRLTGDSTPVVATISTNGEEAQDLVQFVSSITASSVHPPQGSISYIPANMLDKNPFTAWNDYNGPAPGIGHTIDIYFSRPVALQRFGIIPGYDKQHHRYGDLWYANERVSEGKLILDSGDIYQINCRDNTRNMQWFNIDNQKPITHLTFEIVAVNPITDPMAIAKGWADLAISEIGLQGTPM